MGKAVAEFAKQKPVIQAPSKTVSLPMSTDEFYKDPGCHTPALYARFGAV
jgi:hypothetical protein